GTDGIRDVWFRESAHHLAREFLPCRNVRAGDDDDLVVSAPPREPDVEARGVDVRSDEGGVCGLALDAMHGRGVCEVHVVRRVLGRDDPGVGGVVDALQLQGGWADVSDPPYRTVLDPGVPIVAPRLHNVTLQNPLLPRTDSDPVRAEL